MPITLDLNGFDSDPDLQQLLHSDAYLQANHPRHAEAVATVTEFFQARHGNQAHGLRKAQPVVIDSADIFRSTYAKPRS